MYTLAIICYERYGTQEYIDFDDLNDVLEVIEKWLNDKDETSIKYHGKTLD